LFPDVAVFFEVELFFEPALLLALLPALFSREETEAIRKVPVSKTTQHVAAQRYHLNLISPPLAVTLAGFL
jgi:hypothetical protein